MMDTIKELIQTELFQTIVFTITIMGLFAWCIYQRNKCDKEIAWMVRCMLDEAPSMLPYEFFSLRTYELDGLGIYAYSKYNFEGVYLIINRTKKKYFVGSSTRVVDAIAAHFEGTGDKAIYKDYKNNNKFIIKMLSLKRSGFPKNKEFQKYITLVCDEEFARYHEDDRK